MVDRIMGRVDVSLVDVSSVGVSSPLPYDQYCSCMPLNSVTDNKLSHLGVLYLPLTNCSQYRTLFGTEV